MASQDDIVRLFRKYAANAQFFKEVGGGKQ
jgi:hypothetical protein